MKNKVQFVIFRFDPSKDKMPHYERYEVPVFEHMVVLEGLLYILDNLDPTLSFRFSCREGICGSCAMLVNRKQRLTCETQILSLKAKEILIEPLSFLPIIKDEVTDLHPFYVQVERVKPYLIRKETPSEREIHQTPKQRKMTKDAEDCILCGACYSSCPMVWTEGTYLGPAALIQAYRLIFDSRDQAKEDRLKILGSENGVWRCHGILNCTDVCPKSIPITSLIAKMKREAINERIKDLLHPIIVHAERKHIKTMAQGIYHPLAKPIRE